MILRKIYIAAMALVLPLLFSQPVLAAYTWVDDQGVYHITDYPKPVPRKDMGNAKTVAPDVAPEVSVPDRKAVPAPEVKQDAKPPVVSVPTPTLGRGIPVTAATLSTSGTQTIKPAPALSQTTGTLSSVTAPATSVTLSQPTTTALITQQDAPAPSQPVTPTTKTVAAAGIMAFLMAFFVVILIFVVLLYIYYSFCLFLIAKKLDVPSPWTAWIPIINIWTILKAAGKPCWWVLLFLIPLVGFIVIVYVWMCIVENLGRNKWLGLLMLVPVVNLVFMGVLAFSKQEEHESLDQEDQSAPEWESDSSSPEEHDN